MATTEQLKALIDSHTKGDESRFRAVAIQIAAVAAKQGKTKLAEELRDLLDRSVPPQRIHSGPATPIARPPRELAGLLACSYPTTRLADMVLPPELSSELKHVVAEYRQRDRLRAHGLSPKQRLLLVGPPGCGKTMTASALAGECHLPLMFVQLHSLITKFMGETAAKLHLIFETMERTPGVYLFDEFDAIGTIRGNQNDVGEIRRVLNSFLQFLERSQSDSIVVAATNLIELLDDALFRRFDAVFEYTLPSTTDAQQLVKNRLSAFDLRNVDWTRALKPAQRMSHADIVRAAEEAAKLAVLDERETVRTEDLAGALQKRRASRPRVRGKQSGRKQ